MKIDSIHLFNWYQYRKKSFIPWTAARNAMLATVRDGTEFMVAVNYLPRNYLWGSTLTFIQVGTFGTCSAFLRLFALFKFNSNRWGVCFSLTVSSDIISQFNYNLIYSKEWHFVLRKYSECKTNDNYSFCPTFCFPNHLQHNY